MKNKLYRIACLNGPNINMLGTRKQIFYGVKTLKTIQMELSALGKDLNCKVEHFQSNCEGNIVDFIQNKRDVLDGILINAGPLSFYGYALRDALEDTHLPIISVHLSNIHTRQEEFRHNDIMANVSIGGIYGFKEESYHFALRALKSHLDKTNSNK